MESVSERHWSQNLLIPILLLLGIGLILQSEFLILVFGSAFLAIAVFCAGVLRLQFSLYELFGAVFVTAALSTIMIELENDVKTGPYIVYCILFSAMLGFSGLVWAWLVRRQSPGKKYHPCLIIAGWCFVLAIAGASTLGFFAFLWLILRVNLTGAENWILLSAAAAALVLPGIFVQRYSEGCVKTPGTDARLPGALEVRPARTEDVSRYAEMARAAQVWLQSRGLDQYVPAAHSENLAAIQERVLSRTLRCVWMNDEPRAFFCIDDASKWWPADGVPALYLSGIVVAREARGNGIGAQIIEWTFAEARARKCDCVRLDCHSGNKWLCARYESQGFVSKGRVTQHPGYIGCLYQRDVKPGA